MQSGIVGSTQLVALHLEVDGRVVGKGNRAATPVDRLTFAPPSIVLHLGIL